MLVKGHTLRLKKQVRCQCYDMIGDYHRQDSEGTGVTDYGTA